MVTSKEGILLKQFMNCFSTSFEALAFSTYNSACLIATFKLFFNINIFFSKSLIVSLKTYFDIKIIN